MKKICFILICLLFCFCSLFSLPRTELAKISVSKKGNFKYLKPDSNLRKTLVDYVKNVTNPKSRDFIPVENRIAVFDMDGTLACETAPCYFEWMLYLERYLNDSNFRATEDELKLAKEIQKAIDEGKSLGSYDYDQAVAQNHGFASLSPEEYSEYLEKFMEKDVPGFLNMKWGEIFYLPMVEVISYLKANEFACYVVSGSERELCRKLVCDVTGIKRSEVIGSDIFIKTNNQGETSNLDYVFKKDADKIIRGELLEKTLKMEKVAKIVTEIGSQPVLAFGNSSGDESMLNYAISNNKYKSHAFLLLADDEIREYGTKEKAEKMNSLCSKNGWTPVSMKNEFNTIYGESVKRK